MADREIKRLSDHSIHIGATDPLDARALADRLRGDELWHDVVPGLSSVTVIVDLAKGPLATAEEVLARRLEQPIESSAVSTPRDVSLAVRYGGDDGPDLQFVAEQAGMSAEDVIRLHTEASYEVAIMGFVPGFAYLSGLPEPLATPRLAEPRLRVPAGSVGIGGSMAGVYALNGSGGWPLIGRTEMKLFDAKAKDPFILTPGTRVKFERA